MGQVVNGFPAQNLVDTYEKVTAYHERVRQRIRSQTPFATVIRVSKTVHYPGMDFQGGLKNTMAMTIGVKRKPQ